MGQSDSTEFQHAVHGRHLATDSSVGDAWTEFFIQIRAAARELRAQRRAAAEGGTDHNGNLDAEALRA